MRNQVSKRHLQVGRIEKFDPLFVEDQLDLLPKRLVAIVDARNHCSLMTLSGVMSRSCRVAHS
jgi:hypothetical protein